MAISEHDGGPLRHLELCLCPCGAAGVASAMEGF